MREMMRLRKMKIKEKGKCQEMINSFSVNIREYLALGNDEEAGEPALVELLSGFSCPKNKDVEHF